LIPVPEDRFDQIATPDDRPTECVGMAPEELGGAVHDEVGAQRQRLLEHRRGEGVVDHGDRPAILAGGEQARQVDDLQRRVGRRLEVEQVAAPVHRLLDTVGVGRVDQLDLHTDPREVLGEQHARAAVGVFHRHHPLARLEQGVEHVGDRGHARRRRRGRLAAFEHPQLLLEHRDGRVGVATVDVAGRRAGSDVEPLVDVRVPEADAVHDGHLGRPVEQVALLAGPHRHRLDRIRRSRAGMVVTRAVGGRHHGQHRRASARVHLQVQIGRVVT